MGNVLTKSDVSGSTWAYHATKKHAVITAGTNSYGYDLNGNQTTRNGETVSWTSYNYPSHVPNGTKYHDYYYDANRQRWKQVYFNGTASETTIFVGGILEKHTANGITEYRHAINAGDQPVALYTRPSSGTITTQYFLLDHLGSVAEVTNSLGTLDVAENFAAFGERRDPSDWSGAPSAADQTIINGATQRGYTFHTNSESSSLIHMNGRMADSLTGRFLSPDPYVFQPLLTQGFNRYSYVNNNPLSFTDPSGFCIDPYISCPASILYSAFSIAKKLFGGRSKPPPPPKGCFGLVSGTACFGKAIVTKLYNIARDIYGLPRLGASPVWGVGDGTFGSGPCGWGPGCMSLGDELGSQTDQPLSEKEVLETMVEHARNGILGFELPRGWTFTYSDKMIACGRPASGIGCSSMRIPAKQATDSG
jgi:RHS repeat-associated protein